MSKIGGMQRVGIDLLHQLEAREDVRTTKIILRSARENDIAGFIPFLFRAWKEARAMMLRGEVDVVLFSAMPSAALASVLAGASAKSSVPLVAISHGHDVIADNAAYQWLVRKVFARLDAMLPVSHSTGQQCVARGLPVERLFVTPNGIDPDRFGTSFPGEMFSRAARRQVLHEQFPQLANAIGDDGLLLCSVGRQVRRKGHEWFIRNVMPQIRSNVHLVLGGKGPETEVIRRAVTELGLADRVHIPGLIAEEKLAPLYTGGDLFIMPNIPVDGDMEGFGVVMLEAGLCGMPSIASHLEGIHDVIIEGVSGFNVAPLDAEGFASIINSYAVSPNRLDALSSTARSHTLETFSWPKVASSIVATLETVISRKSARA